MIKLLYPVPSNAPVTQTFEEHVQRAKRNGWCYKPGPCPGGVHYNGGIDWGIRIDTWIISTYPGEEVKQIRHDNTGYGNHIRTQVIIDGVEYTFIYAHLKSMCVNVGDVLEVGTHIGNSGNSGNSTGPHLHYEMRVNGIPRDPAPYLVTCYDDEPEPEQPEIEIPEFPKLPLAKIMADPYLMIRSGPSTDFGIVGALELGVTVNVIGFIQQKHSGDIWLHIGYHQYCAMRYQGNVYAEWI